MSMLLLLCTPICAATQVGLTMDRGFPIVGSTKQKLNTKSSTESELVGVDDAYHCLELLFSDGSRIRCNPESCVTRQQELHVVEEEW
jgi:hypothetical protein